MKQQIEQLLKEWHPNEIGRMVGPTRCTATFMAMGHASPQHPLSARQSIAVGRAVVAVAAGRAINGSAVCCKRAGRASRPSQGGCCGEGKGYDDLLHISSPS